METARSPLVVLSADLCVEQANRAFYQLFQVTSTETEEHFFTQLGYGQWNIPQLSTLLAEIVTSDRSFVEPAALVIHQQAQEPRETNMKTDN